jgi:hypothetical protein
MKIGTRVADRYGEVGRITKLYDDFSAVAASCLTMTGYEWLAAQDLPFPDKALTEIWAEVTMDRGSIWSPISYLRLVAEGESA